MFVFFMTLFFMTFLLVSTSFAQSTGQNLEETDFVVSNLPSETFEGINVDVYEIKLKKFNLPFRTIFKFQSNLELNESEKSRLDRIGGAMAQGLATQCVEFNCQIIEMIGLAGKSQSSEIKIENIVTSDKTRIVRSTFYIKEE